LINVSPTTTTTTTTKQNLDPRCTYVHAGKNNIILYFIGVMRIDKVCLLQKCIPGSQILGGNPQQKSS
jgi:hypothetical protein